MHGIIVNTHGLSMMLTLMQGHSDSAEEKIQL